MKYILLGAFLLVVTGCITPYEPRTPDTVEVLSNYPVLRLDGEPVQDPYRIFMRAGEHELEIQYRTYTNEPVCRFLLQASENTRYEVTDSGEEYPLTLYRWVYVNKLWSRRTEPLDPIVCQ